MSLAMESKTYYYLYKGEINTLHVLNLALRRSLELDNIPIIIASETGRSVLKAIQLRNTRYNKGQKIIVVTHPPDKTYGPKGDIPIGLNDPRYISVKECIVNEGITIVQGSRPFASASRSIGWDKALPDTLIDKLLGGVFGQGLKIAIEASLMATDAGAVNRGDIVISLGGTYKGLDTAIVAKTTYSYYFLSEYELLELLAKPYYPRVSYPEYEDPNWKGDLDQYYRESEC